MSKDKRRPPSAPAASPGPAALPRREPAAMAAAGLALLGLYLAWPEKVFVFDGIMFASVIERSIDEWRTALWNRRHLLFNPLLMGLRDALAWAGIKLGGYELMQRTNAVLGAAGVLLFYRLLRRLSPERGLAAVGAALLAVSCAYWNRAVEGQAYMAMTLGTLATAWAAVACLQAGTPRAALVLGAVFALSVLVHAANAFLGPMVAAALVLAWRRTRGFSLWGAAAACAAAVAVPYLAVFRITGPESLFSFLLKATEFHGAGGRSDWGSLVAGFFTAPGASPLTRLSGTFRELFASLVSPPFGEAAQAWGGAALAAPLAAAARAAWRSEDREPAAALLLGALGFVFLNAFWRGGLFFWAAPWALLLAAASLPAARALSRPEAPRRAVLAGAAALVAALGAWNLAASVIPQSRLENNEGYRRTMFVQQHTVASSWILISGIGYPNSKVYLPHFARRSREVLEYYFLGFSKEEGLERFAAWVRSVVEAGIPLYLLSDLVEDARVLREVRELWGVTQAELTACFGPGELVLLAAQDEAFRVFLFLPKQRRERLYASLSYSVLTEPEGPRLSVTAGALKRVAESMGPAEKALAAKTLRETNYGFDLLWQGFSGYMSPESRARAEQRLALFRSYQGTGNFHLRLGNILGFLGRKDEVRKAWLEAYRLSPDPSLKKSLDSMGTPFHGVPK